MQLGGSITDKIIAFLFGAPAVGVFSWVVKKAGGNYASIAAALTLAAGWFFIFAVWFFGGRRNRLEMQALQALLAFETRWNELKGARARVAGCVLSGHRSPTVANRAVHLKDSSSDTSQPQVIQEADVVLKFFEDLAQDEYKWQYALEEFRHRFQVPLLAYCHGLRDVIEARKNQTPVRSSELLKVVEKYSTDSEDLLGYIGKERAL